MPTDRFYRLSEEKKHMIREAAIKEFARVPFEKASINRIIKDAAISRGSFYTYFADKQDVVSFIFEDSHDQIKKYCYNSLEQSGGDYFQMLRDLFDFFIDLLGAENMMDMARNVFSYQDNMAAMGFRSEQDFPSEEETLCMSMKYLDRINQEGWRIHSEEDKRALMMLGMSALLLAMAQVYKQQEKLERVRRLFDAKLRLLQYGTYGTDHRPN